MPMTDILSFDTICKRISQIDIHLKYSQLNFH